MENIKVSVIVPVYNVEKYLHRCLDSIINQTLKEIEIICVNDCSTDSSLNILENYKDKEDRIIIINHQKNLRLAAARNSGMKAAKGEYISFIDSDDYIENNFLENLYKSAKNNDADISCARVEEFINNNYQDENYVNFWSFYNKNSDILIKPEDKFGYIYSCAVWNKIYRRYFININNIRFYEDLYIEDVPFTHATAILSNKIVLVNDTHYYYNRGNISSNMMDAKKSKKALDTINLTKKSREFLEGKLFDNADTLKYYQILNGFEIYNLFGWLNGINKKYRNKYYKIMRKVFLNLNIENNNFILEEYLNIYNKVVKYKNYTNFLLEKNINRIFDIVSDNEYKILFILFIKISIKLKSGKRMKPDKNTNSINQIINDIVWYIPFKKLRNQVRQLLLIYFNNLNELTAIKDDLNIIKNNINELYVIKDNLNALNLDIKTLKEKKDFSVERRAYNILSDMILYKDKSKIFYLQTPEHGNIGDHAIVYSSTKLLKDIYKDKTILEYSYNDLLQIGDLVDKFITKDDIIFLPGGGNMGDLYLNEEILRREIIKKYSDNKIIIFPESITYTNEKELELSKKIYNSHNNFTIFTRDEKSYSFAKEHFYNNKIILMPDIVLYLENKLDDNLLISRDKRESIIFILRDDKEKIVDNDLINIIKNEYTNYSEYDTYLNINIYKEKRK